MARMTLSHEDTIKAGEEAWKKLQAGGDDYNHWIRVGRALVLLRDDAQRRAGNHTGRFFNSIMGPLLAQHGFDAINKATRSHLLTVIDRYDAVTEWRRTLTADQRLRFNHPATILRRCPIFRKPADPKATPQPSPMAQLHERNVALQEENHRLRQKLDHSADSAPIDAAKIEAELRLKIEAELRLKLEAEARIAERELRVEYERRYAPFSPADRAKINRCLHPDTAPHVTEAQRNEAFRLFNDADRDREKREQQAEEMYSQMEQSREAVRAAHSARSKAAWARRKARAD
jgi:hypothetical protein